MIRISDNYCQLDTLNTSMLFRITRHGDAEQLYYGKKIPFKDRSVTVEKRSVLLVNTIYPENDESYGIDAMNFVYSYRHRGDIRKTAFTAMDNHGEVFDFVFEKFVTGCDLPNYVYDCPGGYDDCMKIVFVDKRGAVLELWITVYEKTDVIGKSTVLINNTDSVIRVEKISSMQLDVDCANKQIVTFSGAWSRERKINITDLNCGRVEFGADAGLSSVECNPFFIIKDIASTQSRGDAYGFNLVYSGSHEFSAEISPYGGLRVLSGISDKSLDYSLKANCVFAAPFAVMTFTDEGLNGVSGNMHAFIRASVLPSIKDVPIMLNTWETMGFDVDENKILEASSIAAELGFEGVVIDDGWFGNRSDDMSSLGDWYENNNKFPSGLKNVIKRIKKKGLRTGIWLEPEMVSIDSRLFESHPDWALFDKLNRPLTGRNQYVLDLTNPEVSDFVFATVANVIDNYGADYIKWDFNRRFCDVLGNGDAYSYDYACALNKILRKINTHYPDIVIEACASGGGRFDLGMLSHCAVAWTSDNSDPLSRAEIQEGTGYGYPLVTMLNHISSSPNFQTNRPSSFRSRKDVACFGTLGAQYDLLTCDEVTASEFKNAISEQKKMRKWLKDSVLYRLEDGITGNDCTWQIMSADGKVGKILLYRKRFYPVTGRKTIKLSGLDKNVEYEITIGNIKFTASGITLMNCGIVLPQNHQGIKTEKDTMPLFDNTSVIIDIELAGGKTEKQKGNKTVNNAN